MQVSSGNLAMDLEDDDDRSDDSDGMFERDEDADLNS
jgi:hypothetical protein